MRGRALKEHLAPAFPSGAGNAYAAAMSDYSEAVARAVERRVLKGTPGPLAFFELQQDIDRLAARFSPAGRRAARAVASSGRAEVERMLDVSFRRTPGRVEGERAFVAAFGQRQEQLLNRIGVVQVAKLQELVAAGASTDELRHAVWVSRNRAQMVAHNEAHALSTDVVAYWAQEAGSSRFYWVTSRDERVRHGHAVLDGKLFRWDSPPDTGRREGHNLPGHPPHCRCRALPEEALEVWRASL